MKLLGFYLLFSLPYLLGLTVAGQETFLMVHHQEQNQESIAASVSQEELPLVSSSVISAEGWVRSHVLAHFPSTKITTIIVGRGILCYKGHESHWGLVLPSVKNLYYSLVRWGLAKEIKVSPAISSACFSSAQNMLKPLLSFLKEFDLAYIIDPPPHSSLTDIRVIKGEEPIRRDLSSLSFPSFPEKPKPLGVLVPSRNPSLPSPQFAPVPDSSFSFAPESSPDLVPAPNPPDIMAPPSPMCLPVVSAPAPAAREENGGLWCVAKPTVPAEKLQEAMDYACGEGGADCEEIMPNGNCYYPDNAVAHASYAFNSYWQKTKNSGGSCSFDRTAILINSDPSFLHCRFLLS